MKITVSLAQINPKSGDLEGNAGKILAAFDTAREQGADLVVLPELCLTGYCLDEKLLLNRTFLRENKRILKAKLMPAARDISAVVGFVDFDAERTGPDGTWVRYNAAAVLAEGEVRQIAHKRLLPSYRYFEDKRYFQAGREAEPVGIPLRGGGEASLGVLICEDIWYEKYEEFRPAAELCRRGAELLAVINASPYEASSPGRRDGKRFQREEMVGRQCDSRQRPLVYVNTVGAGDNGKNLIMFDGFSHACDARGELVCQLECFREGQKAVTFVDGEAEPVDPLPFDREGEIFEALALGVRDYCAKVGFSKVLVPVSGGIDSALGAAVCCEAVGKENVLLYNLPTRFNTEATRGLAAQLAHNLGAEYKIVPIEKMVQAVRREFEAHVHPLQRGVTCENLQSRLRGVVMMMESNELGALLISNGNSTEIALGYATLYGDMAGGLSPIGDLTKPDVYRLARYVNRRAGREVIPRGILEMAPSAELAEGQEDPYEYDVVGPVVEDCVEHSLSPGELQDLFDSRGLDESRYPDDIYTRYDSRGFRELCEGLFRTLNRSVFKRLQGAPIIAVSDRAFGFDLRETLINGWEG